MADEKSKERKKTEELTQKIKELLERSNEEDVHKSTSTSGQPKGLLIQIFILMREEEFIVIIYTNFFRTGKNFVFESKPIWVGFSAKQKR